MPDKHSEKKRRLIEERDRLSRELQGLIAESAPTSERREGSPFGKREEEATQFSEMATRSAIEQGINALLQEIDHALRKFDEGSYGYCDQCGQPINPERLEALPQASLCLKCKVQRAPKR